MGAFPEWTKLSSAARDELRGSEDYLTARTFGLLRFCGPSLVGEVLAGLGVAASGVADLTVELWPSLGHQPSEVGEILGMTIVEPDVLVRGSGMVLTVEAKFHGSALGHYRSQLGREWLLASALAQRCGWRGVCLLAVTSDVAEPRVPDWAGQGAATMCEQIASFVADMAKRGAPIATPLPTAADLAATVRWTSWAHLFDVVEDVARRAQGAERKVLDEVLAALDALGCTRFTGFRHPGCPGLPAAPAGILLRGSVPNRFAFTDSRLLAAAPASLLGRS